MFLYNRKNGKKENTKVLLRGKDGAELKVLFSLSYF